MARTSVVCDRKGMTLDRLMRCGFPFLMEMKNGVVLGCEVKEQMGIFFSWQSLEVPGEGEAEGTIYHEGWTKNEDLVRSMAGYKP